MRHARLLVIHQPQCLPSSAPSALYPGPISNGFSTCVRFPSMIYHSLATRDEPEQLKPRRASYSLSIIVPPRPYQLLFYPDFLASGERGAISKLIPFPQTPLVLTNCQVGHLSGPSRTFRAKLETDARNLLVRARLQKISIVKSIVIIILENP